MCFLLLMGMFLVFGDVYANEASSFIFSGSHSGIMWLLLFGVFYFFLLRPFLRKQKVHMQTVNNLEVGMKVVLYCGIVGVVSEINSDFVKLIINFSALKTTNSKTESSQVDILVSKSSIMNSIEEIPSFTK